MLFFGVWVYVYVGEGGFFFVLGCWFYDDLWVVVVKQFVGWQFVVQEVVEVVLLYFVVFYDVVWGLDGGDCCGFLVLLYFFDLLEFGVVGVDDFLGEFQFDEDVVFFCQGVLEFVGFYLVVQVQDCLFVYLVFFGLCFFVVDQVVVDFGCYCYVDVFVLLEYVQGFVVVCQLEYDVCFDGGVVGYYQFFVFGWYDYFVQGVGQQFYGVFVEYFYYCQVV